MAENDIGNKGLIVIGGSAGSLSALLKIFEHVGNWQLPPIVLVLHRKQFYDNLLTDLLANKTKLMVKEAEEKEALVPGTLYVAPADYHLLIENNHTISLDTSEKVNFSRPSINVTFESAAEVYKQHLVAILLSGANADGTDGLDAVIEFEGTVIIQDPRTAEVAYMPEQAISKGLACSVLSPDEIGKLISSIVKA